MTRLSVRFCVGLLAFGAIAEAGIIPSTPTVTPIGGGVFSWSYNINLETGEGLSSSVPPASNGNPSGDYFTIYDVVGFDGGVVVPNANWTATVQLTGVTPPTESVPDSGAIDNITFFYTGSTLIIGTGQSIGSFGFNSTDGSSTSGVFAAETLNVATGGVDQENGSVLVPEATAPEPSTTCLILFGGTAMAAAFRRRSHGPAAK